MSICLNLIYQSIIPQTIVKSVAQLCKTPRSLFCFELRFKLIKISFKFVSFWILCIESARLALLYTALAPARVTSYFIKEFMFSQTKHFKETKQWRYFRKNISLFQKD